MMLSKDEVQEKEEELRKLVRELPDDKRFIFYHDAEKELKDPDTYATLNYIFIAGLHHFYLGKWQRGLTNIIVFWVGVFLLFTDYIAVGVLIVLSISIFELLELFQSEVIVQSHNNKIMEKIYHKYQSHLKSPFSHKK